MIKRQKDKGFSLIELLIVVAIILIIAAIAIPNLLRARMAAKQASAVGSVRTINTSAATCSQHAMDLTRFWLGPSYKQGDLSRPFRSPKMVKKWPPEEVSVRERL